MLKVNRLSVEYGAVTAVREVSFEVPKGSIVALVGANGAGKSSLLSAISGLVPYKGSVTYHGEPLPKRSHSIVSKGLVHVPEGRRIFSNLTVYDNLMSGAFTRWNIKDIQEDLQRVYTLFPILEPRNSQYAGTLSGGERQMLAIARALMSRPRMLLIDEPSLGLSPLLASQVLGLIEEVNAQGVTILLVDQNARKSLQIADYAYVMQQGKIVKEGQASELLNDPAVQIAYLGGRSAG
ncbi:MAG: ABC transporter ATP-binding protein [Firmicutes bacterium]|nr:ABC transporter ATP-binding protein [Bacillota bacterium]